MQFVATSASPPSDSGELEPQEEGESAADLNATLLALDPQQLVIAGLEQEGDEEDNEGDEEEEEEGCHIERVPHAATHGSKVMPDTRRYSGPGDGELGDETPVPGRQREREAAVPATSTPPRDLQAKSRERHEPDRSSILNADFAIWSIVQLLSAAMDKQIYMSAGALVLSLVLGTCALYFRDEILNATHVNAGLILGSAGTLAMCSIIIGTYLTTKWYRRHMHILLLNLAVFDLLLALSFVLEPAWKRIGASVGEGHTCQWVRAGAPIARHRCSQPNVCLRLTSSRSCAST